MKCQMWLRLLASPYSRHFHSCIENDEFLTNFLSSLRRTSLRSGWSQMILLVFTFIVSSLKLFQFRLTFLQTFKMPVFAWLKTKFPDFSLTLNNFFSLIISWLVATLSQAMSNINVLFPILVIFTSKHIQNMLHKWIICLALFTACIKVCHLC